MAKRSRGGSNRWEEQLKTFGKLTGSTVAGYLLGAFVRSTVAKMLVESQKNNPDKAMKPDTMSLIKAAVPAVVGVGAMHVLRGRVQDPIRYAVAGGCGVAAGEAALEHSKLGKLADKINSLAGDESTVIPISSADDIRAVLHAVESRSPALLSATRDMRGTLANPFSGTLASPFSGNDPFQSSFDASMRQPLTGNHDSLMVRRVAA